MTKLIFSTKDVFKTSNKKNTDVFNQSIITEDKNHEFFISKGYKHFEKQLQSLEPDKQYSFVSFGQWSLKHVVFHVLKLIGSADIYSTTYGLGPKSAQGIVSGLKKGIIKSFNFIYDNKIKHYKVEAHDICVSNFPVKIAAIHAKVTVLFSENYSVTITGSANWSDSNNKIESTIISTLPGLAEFHRKWILNTMQTQSPEPSKIIQEINQTINS